MGNVELSEAGTFGCELIESWSLGDVTAVAGEIPEAKIVGVKEKDVGAGCSVGCTDWTGSGLQERQCEQACDDAFHRKPWFARFCTVSQSRIQGTAAVHRGKFVVGEIALLGS
jgi:hypothetical protein